MRKDDKHDLAVYRYSEAIRANPRDYRAYNNRGNAYGRKGKYELAIEDYNRAIGINPGFALAYINRGNAYQEMGLHARAISDYDRAIELSPASDMAANFWRAWWAWLVCFSMTILISLFTAKKPKEELFGLVKGLTGAARGARIHPPTSRSGRFQS